MDFALPHCTGTLLDARVFPGRRSVPVTLLVLMARAQRRHPCPSDHVCQLEHPLLSTASLAVLLPMLLAAPMHQSHMLR